jgi:hypothetical protein
MIRSIAQWSSKQWSKKRALALLLLTCIPLAPSSLLAQATNTGTIVGTVTDQSGAVIAGATITVTDTTSNSVRTATSSKSGQYAIINVPPADYRVTVEKSGFSISEIAKQTVSVGTQTTANFKLAIGTEQTTIEVQASGADLQTLNATVGDTVPPEMIDSLPAVGRDVTTFATLQPGVSPEGSVAGAVVDQNTFQLDGGNNSSDMDGSGNVYTPSFAGDPTGGVAGSGSAGVIPTPADSVEEFKSNTANQTADFDNSSGAQIQIVTKRGTTSWHGTAYEYYLDNNLNANTWQNNLTQQPIPSYIFNRYGFAGGGPIIPKEILGGKTFFFANYEALRFPNAETYERAVPSALMRQGIVQFADATVPGQIDQYNLNTLDPRGIGLNPIINQLWSKYEPVGNDPGCTYISGSYCDTNNTIGYEATLKLPTRTDFAVVRVDHDFGPRNHFMASYRYFREIRSTDQQVDIGGAFTGDTLGTPVATFSKPQQPWFFVTQFTTTISTGITNDFHYSYTRNLWAWNDSGAPPQISGLGGVLEPGGEGAGSTGVLAPFNVNAQSIRTRIWDGHDNFLSDNVTWLKGNHLLTFGGQYQHNFNYHQRTDNGGGINYTTTYQIGDSNGAGNVNLAALQAAGYPTGKNPSRAAAEVLGLVTDSQVAYTRTGSDLTLNPPLTPAADKVTIPFYNVYFSDSWHLKPSLTITYGLGYTLEMPPTEASGKQVEVVDANDAPIEINDYLNQRKLAAQQGQVYNPSVGFALVHNVTPSLKYPYNPDYQEFSPRVAAAWNPKFDSESLLGKIFGSSATVVRGGYGRIYGRLNGVDLVLVPLLGVGLIQPVQCTKPLASGACGGNPTDTTAFRIGVDGNTAPLAAATTTLPQPLYPGYNSGATSAAEGLDPHFRPNGVDSFDLTIQRQLTHKTILEVGYIGRLIHHEYQPINMNAVPYMMSQGGQTFAAAYAALEVAMGCSQSAAKCIQTVSNASSNTPVFPNVTAQPFFETALAGTGYCTGYANCTTAVLMNEIGNLGNQDVWHLWSDLDGGNYTTALGNTGGFNFPRSMMNTPIPGQANGSSGVATSGIALNASTGYGNYHGGFITFKANDWHGLTLQENFTYSKALGTGAEVQADSEYTPNDAFNLGSMYGVQYFNHKFLFNTFLVWQTPWYKGQHGLLGRIAGGYTIAPVFVAGSGAPLYCNTNTDSGAFGSGDSNNYFDNEQCVFTTKYNGGVSTHRNIGGSTDPYGNTVGNQTAGSGPAAVNMFQNPAAVFDQVRAPILGIDTKNPGTGPISGLPYWNMDLSLQKNIEVAEHIQIQLSMITTNVFNHLVFANTGSGGPASGGTGEGGGLGLTTAPTWGVITAQGNNPRAMQFGFRVRY